MRTEIESLGQKAISFYLPELLNNPQAKVLDVGCGSGGFLEEIKRMGCTALGGPLH